MENKNAIVTKVTKMDKQDNYGNFSYVVEFSNADKGFYTTKEAEQKKFVVNQTVEYTIEKKTGSTGKDYCKVALPKAEGGFQGGGAGFKKQPGSVGSFCLSYSKDILVAQITNPMGNAKPMATDEMFSLAEKMYNWLQTHP